MFLHKIVCDIHNNRISSIIPYLEADAIHLCNERKDTIELQELSAIAALYTRLFFSRWLRGLRQDATNIGFIAAKQANAIRSVNLKLTLLPRLIQMLFASCRFGEGVSLLQELSIYCFAFQIHTLKLRE